MLRKSTWRLIGTVVLVGILPSLLFLHPQTRSASAQSYPGQDFNWEHFFAALGFDAATSLNPAALLIALSGSANGLTLLDDRDAAQADGDAAVRYYGQIVDGDHSLATCINYLDYRRSLIAHVWTMDQNAVGSIFPGEGAVSDLLNHLDRDTLPAASEGLARVIFRDFDREATRRGCPDPTNTAVNVDPTTHQVSTFVRERSRSSEAAPAPVTISISVDRGAGATYAEGDGISICITVSRPVTVRLRSGIDTDAPGVVLEESMSGRHCIDTQIQPPLGQEVMVAEAVEGGQVVGSSTVRFRSAARPANSTGPVRQPDSVEEIARAAASSSACPQPSPGDLFQSSGNPTIYLYVAGALHGIPDPDTFVARGFTGRPIQSVSAACLAGMHPGEPLPSAHLDLSLTVDRGDGGVYYPGESAHLCLTVSRNTTVNVRTASQFGRMERPEEPNLSAQAGTQCQDISLTMAPDRITQYVEAVENGNRVAALVSFRVEERPEVVRQRQQQAQTQAQQQADQQAEQQYQQQVAQWQYLVSQQQAQYQQQLQQWQAQPTVQQPYTQPATGGVGIGAGAASNPGVAQQRQQSSSSVSSGASVGASGGTAGSSQGSCPSFNYNNSGCVPIYGPSNCTSGPQGAWTGDINRGGLVSTTTINCR